MAQKRYHFGRSARSLHQSGSLSGKLAGMCVFVVAFNSRNITQFSALVNPVDRKGEKVGAISVKNLKIRNVREEKQENPGKIGYHNQERAVVYVRLHISPIMSKNVTVSTIYCGIFPQKTRQIDKKFT